MGEIHHLKVGCGDCSIVISDNHTFVFDCHDIESHKSLLPKSKKIKAVFITHQHYDHFDGLEYLKNSNYEIEYLVYSPYDRRRGDNSVALDEWNSFNSYKDHFSSKGTKLYPVFRQEDFSKPWWTIDGVKIHILGPSKSVAQSETRELHDAALVIKLTIGARKCLFTGDASDSNLNDVATTTNHICDDILHASHHGSINGADLDFIKKCNAKYTVISTESGVHDNVPHPTALKRYKDNTTETVYRTDVDGSLKWSA